MCVYFAPFFFPPFLTMGEWLQGNDGLGEVLVVIRVWSGRVHTCGGTNTKHMLQGQYLHLYIV